MFKSKMSFITRLTRNLIGGKMLPQLTAGILACQNGSALTRLNRHLVLARHFGILEGLGGMAVVGAAAAYYHHKKLDRLAMPGPKGSRTVERSDGSRVIYTMKDRELMKTVDPNLKALPDLVRKGLKLSQNGDMLGRRNTQKEGAPWEWIQYADAIQKSKDMAYGFRCLNVPIGQKTCIGIFMKNRPEWILTEMACHVFNNVSVPIYDSAHIDHIVHIVNETEMPLIVVSNGKKAKILMSRIKCMPKVRYIVTIDAFDEPYLKHAAEENNIRMLSLEELETLGREMPDKPNVAEPKPEDVATICYTSGTTGLPKGVILTHGNFVSAYSATTLWPEGKNPWQPGGAMISYLPLAHIMEHYFEYGVFLHGGKVGHFRGDVSQLLDDMQTLQPIVVPAVPRILNKICDSVDQELSKSPIKRAIFNLGIAYKKYELSRGVVRNDSLVDKIVFRKIQGLFGGRMKWMLTGSAPVSVEVMTFARCAFGCVVTEGYGQTETCAPSTARKKLAIDA
ncbi:hypothetical protein WR25_00611 [Diploscapter pachys]|uniref:long-chain-fatty-acid--CoA ligase n=1 Tax=Diploscapter pachys TaxID=2018661 RepID=A0A2A2KIE0_9BILA|nr:hypothetical protein WR25_00611 [Diploscapter pachys]